MLRPAIRTKLASNFIIKNARMERRSRRREEEEYRQKYKDDLLEGGDDPNRLFQE